MKSGVKKQLTRKQLLEKIRNHKSGDALLDLREVRLWGAKLNNAYLCGADLQEAILEGADLMRANLLDADLRGANLQGTNLIYADLRGASLEGAILEGAKMVILKGHLKFTFTAEKLADLLPSLALDPSRTKYYGAKKNLVIVEIKKLSGNQYCFKKWG